MSEILTVDEAAAKAKVSNTTIYRALESGALTGSKIRGRGARGSSWRIFDHDLEAWLVALRPHAAANPSRRRPAPRRPEGSLRALDDTLEGRTA